MPSGQAKMSKLHGTSCKNQSFELFAIECVWEYILEGFWGWVGANFGCLLAFRIDLESWYNVEGSKKCGGVQPHRSKLRFFDPLGGGKQGGGAAIVTTRRSPLCRQQGSADLTEWIWSESSCVYHDQHTNDLHVSIRINTRIILLCISWSTHESSSCVYHGRHKKNLSVWIMIDTMTIFLRLSW